MQISKALKTLKYKAFFYDIAQIAPKIILYTRFIFSTSIFNSLCYEQNTI